jgi:hypothetical protein
LEVALSQLWEGLFGRRKPATMKTREASRDNEHEEDVVPRLMFKTLCEGVRRKVRHGHCRRRPPPAAAGRRGSPRVVVVVAVVRRRFSAGHGKDDGNDGTGDTFVMTTTMTTQNI